MRRYFSESTLEYGEQTQTPRGTACFSRGRKLHAHKLSALKTSRKAISKRYSQAASKLRSEIGNQNGFSPEAVHDLRVATRRMQAVYKILPKEIRELESTTRSEVTLGKILKATSRLRDRDTLRSTLGPHAPSLPQGLLDSLVTQRGKDVAESMKALGRLQSVYPATLHLQKTTNKALSRSLDTRAKKRETIVRRLLVKVTADESKVKVLHELRKQVKKLRYSLELSDKEVPNIPVLTEWQEELGKIHDLDVAIDYLRGSADGTLLGRLRDDRHKSYLRFVMTARDTISQTP